MAIPPCWKSSRTASAPWPRTISAGRRWSRDKGYKGYTSYASLNDLPRRDPAFADSARLLGRHAAAFAGELAFDLPRKPRLDSLWVNLLKAGGHHSSHLHPHSILSGTLYVEVPPAAVRSASRIRARG